MKMTCPSCGAIASADAWNNDARWRELLQVSSSLPAPLPPVVLGYLSLFRPGKSALSVSKALRVAKELSALVAMGHIQVQGKVARPAPPHLWATAMEQMTERRNTLSLPLKNHNYLRQIVWQLADQEDAAREVSRSNGLNSANSSKGSSRTGPAEGGMSQIMRQYLEKQKGEHEEE